MNIKLLKDLDFAGKLNAGEAVTEAGKDLLKNYRGYMYSNAATCGIVNGFIAEAKNFSYDAGLVGILESVLSFVTENNISWKLASACEGITSRPSTYNYIAQVGVGQVEKLLEMNESDVISYIKAGALKGVQYIPEFRSICKEIYNSTVNEVHACNYNVTCPVSYVTVDENQNQYFNVLGKTFKIAEGKVVESTIEDNTFNRVNALLESFTKNENAIEYVHTGIHGDTCKFSIDENGLTLTKGANINEHFDNVTSFIEYTNTISRPMNIQEKMNFNRTCAAVAEVFEAFDNVVVLDCVNLMNCSNGTVCAIVEANDNVNLTVYRSINKGTSSKSYDYVAEALSEIISLTGVDLKFMYENRINEDAKKQDPEGYQAIKEELEANKTAQMDIRKKKIAMLAEKYKNDPARIAIINKMAKDLSILESLD